jgi:hypothetical protein
MVGSFFFRIEDSEQRRDNAWRMFGREGRIGPRLTLQFPCFFIHGAWARPVDFSPGEVTK